MKRNLKKYFVSFIVYTGGGMDIQVPGLGGRNYPPFGAVCLEDQNFPDAVNHPNFPNSILRPGEKYTHSCVIEIAPVEQ